MAEPGRARGRGRDVAAMERGRRAGPRRRGSTDLADLARRIAQRIAGMGAGRGRRRAGWCPGSPVAFGCGIVVYFAADREPAALGGGRAARSRAVRRRGPGAPAADRLFRWSLGARRDGGRLCHRDRQARASSRIRCWRRRCGTPTSRGFVEMREERERSDRIVVRVDRIAGAAAQRDARARAGLGAQGHGAGGRQLRRVQGAAVAAARAAAARRLRLRARHVFPAASARPASCSARSGPPTPPARAGAAGCAMPPSSTACARRSTSASARSCRATAARSPRR